ncbi:hypothetical protein EMIHUDRAFT_251456 [Emiliania huxleyi CCMP1516]|uniref:Uncharacterized protein n=2 Tax=Emiliania huxleyi TaxID=2903 RepID=A0A0D3KU54_EMIH1|nr:hypothetical protein EMIHUDRAFT_251456 [Emiliania huxleyi CCMP1516]EOD39289.1 hypothetical protein EMIHUDRAFT_251456 [Emiliania huxleyi CCMP1516]|eukprot:XP_005791718.1 hypothetical protein EMIHUDRAFT_251456 [Emiliania huxleyi CCMP1516]
MAPKKATKGAVKVPAVPKPSKTFVAGQREKHAGGHVDVGAEALALAANLVHGSASDRVVPHLGGRGVVPRLVQAEEVEKVRAELVKVPENDLEMQPVVTAAAAPLADGLVPVVKEAFGPGAKVKQMRFKSGVRTEVEEAKIKAAVEKAEAESPPVLADLIQKLIELITQGGKLRVQLPETGWTPPTVFSFNVPCICGRHSVRVTKQSSTITTTITWDVNVCALRTPAAPWERLVANGSPPSLRHGTACATLKPDARSVVCVFGGVDPAAPLGACYLGDLHVLDVNKSLMVWRHLRPRGDASWPQPRAYHTATAVDKRNLLVFGGIAALCLPIPCSRLSA